MVIGIFSTKCFLRYTLKIVLLKTIGMALALCVSSPLSAQPSPAMLESAKTCLADSTSGRDRKLLIRWMFVSLSSHPDLAEFKPSLNIKPEVDRAFAQLVVRLFTQDCAKHFRAIGSEGFGQAFGHLGRVSFQELNSNKDVSSGLLDFIKYLDMKIIEEVIKN